MLVRDVMTTAPTVCKSTDSIERVAKLMAEHDCGAIPVCDAGNVVGMITDRDISCRVVATGTAADSVAASLVMSKPVCTVRQDEPVETAIDLMKTRQVRRLPVVNDEGVIVGIIAPSDLAPTLASLDVADFLLAVSYWTRKSAA